MSILSTIKEQIQLAESVNKKYDKLYRELGGNPSDVGDVVNHDDDLKSALMSVKMNIKRLEELAELFTETIIGDKEFVVHYACEDCGREFIIKQPEDMVNIVEHTCICGNFELSLIHMSSAAIAAYNIDPDMYPDSGEALTDLKSVILQVHEDDFVNTVCVDCQSGDMNYPIKDLKDWKCASCGHTGYQIVEGASNKALKKVESVTGKEAVVFKVNHDSSLENPDNYVDEDMSTGSYIVADCSDCGRIIYNMPASDFEKDMGCPCCDSGKLDYVEPQVGLINTMVDWAEVKPK